MIDLELLDAEYVGIEPMDIVRALPGVLKGTGQALDTKKPTAAPPPPPPPVTPGIWPGWWIGGGAAAAGLLIAILRR